MNYNEWANQYEKDALEIQRTIEKYKKKLKHCRNREELNATIFKYELIYHELIGTANRLRKKGAEE